MGKAQNSAWPVEACGTRTMEEKNMWAHPNSWAQSSARLTPVSDVERQVGLQQPMWTASKSKEGCRKVQDVLEDTTGAVTEDMKAFLVSQLASHVMAGMKCPNANHVLQCILTQLRQTDSQFIVDELLVDVRRTVMCT